MALVTKIMMGLAILAGGARIFLGMSIPEKVIELQSARDKYKKSSSDFHRAKPQAQAKAKEEAAEAAKEEPVAEDTEESVEEVTDEAPAGGDEKEEEK